ncbi:CDP-diacylglycerol--glycerol-3-phosphate 3-phosphatidyltransferase [bioreactor metagenome]|uniref:CDP-diacylglycerol--glycerol-3-phosphate 3-phosphatidyltransferase n=1 Tax=bioreactor metagenome TaxID=1076179 RepID=A0A645B0S8_9ZZZZ|nr:CDP-alcohol phosphatidyltransferase family protein [Candidatus Pelethousia sp.]NCB31150.1 CDP-diacylglycerol--glycerol-3-phosphate 3-phosphatidyltransferase [Clostridia bacterium]
MKHIPNILSGLRLGMVGVFLYFFRRDDYLAALIIYATAFLTDILDGYLARRNGWISNLGKILDPLADKLMLLCALACFYVKGWLPLFIPLIAAGKELTMLVGGLFMLGKKNVVVVSDWWGKFAAGFFNVSVLLTLLSNFSPFSFLATYTVALFCLAIGFAIIAVIHYARTQVLGRGKAEQGDSML